MSTITAPNAERLCIYIGEDDRWRSKPLYTAILEILQTHGIAGATVLRGLAGYGAHSRIHTAAGARLSADRPLRIEVIDAPEKIAQAVELLTPMLHEGLMTREAVQIVRYTRRSLNPLPADKRVGEVMTQAVISVAPETPAAEIWQRMLTFMVKGLPVVDFGGQVVGILTDQDLLNSTKLTQRLSVAKYLDSETLNQELAALVDSPLKASDIMTEPVVTTYPEETLREAATRMAKYGIKRLPVVDQNKRLVGMLSRLDILRQVADTPPKEYSQPARSGMMRTVSDVMSLQVPRVPLAASLADVVNALLESGTHRLIVVDESGRAAGLISDSDVVARIQPQQRPNVIQALLRRAPAPASPITARQLMSPGVLSAAPDMPIAEAVRQMMAAGRKWLVVIDPPGRPLGLVDRQIALRAVVGEIEEKDDAE